MGVNSVSSVLVRSQNEEMKKVKKTKKNKKTNPAKCTGTESFQLLKVKVDWRGRMTK